MSAYQSKPEPLTNMGVNNKMNFVIGMTKFNVGSKKEDMMTKDAQKKASMPAPHLYTPELEWKPKNNFQKLIKTPKVTMTAEILQKKKQLGPGSHKIRFDSRYHGYSKLYPAPDSQP